MRVLSLSLLLAIGLLSRVTAADQLPDISSVKPDLTIPEVTAGEPSPGRLVRRVAPDFKGTDVHHLIYLPTDWKLEGKYPVIVEYPGNGPYKNRHGDISTGEVEGCRLGYGASGGKGYIWICMPFISQDGKKNQRQWWGGVDASVKYCKETVRRECKTWGGDPKRVILSGFSRGAIACNYIGLYDDDIASLWSGFICHSHYDGVIKWGYPGSDREAAAVRLGRLGKRPQFVTHEGSVQGAQDYLKEAAPEGNFTFHALPYHNHTNAWVLRDIPLRKELRSWLQKKGAPSGAPE